MRHRVRGVVLGTLAVLFVPQVAFAKPRAGRRPAPPPADAAPAPDAGAEPAPAATPDVLTGAAPDAGAEPATAPLGEPSGEASDPGALSAVTPQVPAAPAAAAPVPEPTFDAPLGVRRAFDWQPFGYLRMQYRIVQNDPNVAFVGRDDGFALQNARVGVQGTYDRMRFVVALDGAVDERVHVNVPEGRLRVGLRDAYLDVAVAGALRTRGGYFETLVDPDLDTDVQRAFIDRPIESRGIRATEGFEASGLPPGRSLGAALRRDPGIPAAGAALGFELAVQNGAHEFASDNDNDTPAVSLSVLARFAGDSWVVASGRFNRRTEGELPFRQDEDDLQGALGARLALGPITVGAGAVVQRTMFPTTGGPDQDAYGAHGQLLVQVPGTLPLAVGYRFGVLDPSSLIVTDRVMEHTAGAVLAVPSHRMRLQLQVSHVVEQAARALSNDRAQLAAEVSL